MHLIQIIRNYLGLSQQELAEKAGITQPDLCEMEIRTPYGRIEKNQRLSEYLGIPIHALVNNDCNLVPLSFFDKHVHADYAKGYAGGIHRVGREGEDAVFNAERERLKLINTSLSHLVLPYYKLRHRPGFDILSFEDDGKPVCIEVKTTTSSESDFVLTKQEYQKANKMTSECTEICPVRTVELTSKMIEDYQNWERTRRMAGCTGEYAKKSKYSNGSGIENTIKHRTTLIRSILQYAKRAELVSRNVASSRDCQIELPKPMRNIFPILTAEEAEMLIKATEGEPLWFQLVVLLATLYGLRRSEIVGLRVEHIDWTAGEITICWTVTQQAIDGKNPSS